MGIDDAIALLPYLFVPGASTATRSSTRGPQKGGSGTATPRCSAARRRRISSSSIGRNSPFGAAAWRLRFTLLASGGLLSAVLAAGLLRGEVVINEIYYNPVEGDHLEFIELFNPDPGAVDIGGWAFTNGIRHRFGDGTLIPGQGYLVVCPLPRAVAERFGLREFYLKLWLGSRF